MIKDITAGGLRMINIKYFIKALKISWLRRIIQSSHDISWSSLSMINFQKLFSLGQGYVNQIKFNILNPFWKELLQNWVQFCKCIKVDSIFTVLNSPVWFNTNYINGDNFYIKDWYNKGVRHVSDLLDEHGNIYEFVDLKNKYNLRGTFLDYHSLLRKIPNEWKDIINNNKVVSILNRYNVNCNIYVQQLIKEKKGCRQFYDTLTEVNKLAVSNKWDREIPDITEREWSNYYTVIKSIKEVKMKDFQYKLTNKILATKSFLHRINRINDNLCEYCHRESETIFHLFIQCENVKRFWAELNEWFRESTNLELNLEAKSILFSWQDKHQLRNFIYVSAKYYIYANKFSGKALNLDVYKAILRKKFQDERYSAHINNKMGKFMTKWWPLYTQLSSE